MKGKCGDAEGIQRVLLGNVMDAARRRHHQRHAFSTVGIVDIAMLPIGVVTWQVRSSMFIAEHFLNLASYRSSAGRRADREYPASSSTVSFLIASSCSWRSGRRPAHKQETNPASKPPPSRSGTAREIQDAWSSAAGALDQSLVHHEVNKFCVGHTVGKADIRTGRQRKKIL